MRGSRVTWYVDQEGHYISTTVCLRCVSHESEWGIGGFNTGNPPEIEVRSS